MLTKSTRPTHGLKLQLAGTALFLLAVLAQPSIAAEKFYRWVNADGATEYTKHRPPEGIPYTEVSPLGIGKGSPAKAATTGESEAQATGVAAAKTQDEKPKKDRKICEQARNNLATLQAHERIRVRDDKGEPYILSEEERQEQIRMAKEAIEENC